MMTTKRRMLLLGWLLGVLSVGVVCAVIVALVLSGVIFDTSATQPHSKLFAWGVHFTMKNSVRRRADANVPQLPLDRATLLAGAREYEAHCIACHGGPGIARAPWVSAMLPTPPYLLGSPSRWSRAELFHIVHDGVKMTGMPAWGEVDSDQQIAEVVAFLEAMPKMTPEQFAQFRAQVRGQMDAQVPGASSPSR